MHIHIYHCNKLYDNAYFREGSIVCLKQDISTDYAGEDELSCSCGKTSDLTKL